MFFFPFLGRDKKKWELKSKQMKGCWHSISRPQVQVDVIISGLQLGGPQLTFGHDLFMAKPTAGITWWTINWAARLHDTVEDNDDIRFEDLESIFGKDVRRNLGQKQKKIRPVFFLGGGVPL